MRSAGILLYRYRDGELEVFLIHPGGPFWAKRDMGAWSLPKGLVEEGEELLATARREFREETGFQVTGPFIELGWLKQPNRKTVYAWAREGDIDAGKLRSNIFSLEWPIGSGIVREYPEADRGEWFTVERAREKISAGQASFLDRLVAHLSA